MASILKVDKLDPQSGTALEIGTSGDTITVPSGASLTLTDSTLSLPTTINTDKLDPKSGTALELGSSGDTITIPSGATFTQSGTMNASAITAGTIATARLGTGTASSSTILYGDQTYKTEPSSGGITHASVWRLTTSFTGNVDPLALNLEVSDDTGYSSLGADMTVSSGVWTFPATGYWRISNNSFYYRSSGDDRGQSVYTSTTINDGTAWNQISGGQSCFIQTTGGSNTYHSNSAEFIFDVTDVSNCKLKFAYDQVISDTTVGGASTNNTTYFTFVRLGDT